MSESFQSMADDFFVNLNLQTTIGLPEGRDTILGFCQAVQKRFGAMTALYQREGREYVLEGDREAGSYQWLELHASHLTAGWFNPPDAEAARAYHRWLVERCVYFLGVGGLDVECLDVTFGFNLDYLGNRDAIVHDALLSGSDLTASAGDGLGRCIECEPNVVYALDDDCCVQARIAVETRCTSYQVRTGNYTEDPISAYLTMRRCPRPGEVLAMDETVTELYSLCEDGAVRVIVPQVVRPIVAAIAAG